MEGISEEAIALAGHWGLNNLIVLWDNNHITIDGTTQIASSTNVKKRFEANNWRVLHCDGHNFESIEKALEKAQTGTQPTLIDCVTTIGFGSPTKAGTPKCHGSPLGAEEVQGLKNNLNWPYEPFEVPSDVLAEWRACGAKQEGRRQQWEQRVEKLQNKDEFLARIKCEIPETLFEKLREYKKELIEKKETIATRKSSQFTLNQLVPEVPCLIGGSADLAAASFTKTSEVQVVSKENYDGQYIHYGIREHAMGGIMNGLAAHGGFIPFTGTFLSFVDYMKPAIRLACLMELQEMYVLTHDSIGVGEDGPTHQPIEQLISLRATPNLFVFRPADSVETVECYETMLQLKHSPSAIVCSRQGLPVLRTSADENLSAKGGYVIKEGSFERDLTIIATGSEVSLAMQSAERLEEAGISVAVVSMPCREIFDKQPEIYQEEVLGLAPRLIIEAASSVGWDRYIGSVGAILGIDSFGASGSGNQLFERFGFTVDNVVSIAEELLEIED